MSLFNEDVETALAMFIQQNHINILLKIKEILPDIQQLYIDALIKQALDDYLDTYGQLEVDMDGNIK